MTTNNWGNAFGAVPAAFSQRVHATVARMQRAPRHAPRKRLALIAACAIVIVAGTAFALTQLGLLDTLQGTLRAFMQPEASQLVQTDIAQTAQQPQHATFTVEEAINDGHQIYAVIRVHGDDDALLMDYDAEASWTTDWWQGGEDADTYSKRAYDSNRTLVQASVMPVDSQGISLMTESAQIHYDGEDILYTVAFPAQDGQASLQLFTFEVFTQDKAHSERQGFGQLDITVPVTDARSFYTAKTPVELPIGNLTMTLLTVEQTPIATYMTCTYQAADGAPDLTHLNLRDGIWADWLDESGTPYPAGTNANALQQTDTGQTRLVTVYRAFDTLPDTITLRFYNGTTGEAFDTVTLALQPIAKEET